MRRATTGNIVLSHILLFLSTLSLRRATCLKSYKLVLLKFLSTLSLRRATPLQWAITRQYPFLSTLSLRRATNRHCFLQQVACISIHALLAESDQLGAWYQCRHGAFLSTLSLRRATFCVVLGQQMYNADFYPRSPCGERPDNPPGPSPEPGFLSTLSLRRAT